MLRRSFLVWAGATGLAAAGSVAAFQRWQEITPTLHYPGRDEGHFLRDRKALPPPSQVLQTDIAILGSGIAGLTAAWKLKKLGKTDMLMVDGPQPHGNAAGGAFGELEYPTGAHYLPLPSPESVHVREILADLGIIQKDPMGEKPYYDERFILHAPEERLLYNGQWQEGFMPTEGVPQWEIDEHTRFFAEVERLRQTHGADGRRVFVFPTVMSSEDPQWQALDRITLKQWLEQSGYRSPTLHWYLNYCCRDDYGTRYDKVSAWAGLHYYCSRWGQAANAANGTWLTWPGGLQPLATGMERASGIKRVAGTVMSLKTTADGVEALCFKLENGKPSTYLVRARKAICAMPVYVAARVVDNIAAYGFDPAKHIPEYAPWMVANFLLKRFPQELQEGPHSPPLSWDNVVLQRAGTGLCRLHPPGYPRAPAGKDRLQRLHRAVRPQAEQRPALDGGRQAGGIAGAGRRRPQNRLWRAVRVLRRAGRHHPARPRDGGAMAQLPRQRRHEGLARGGRADSVRACRPFGLLGIRGGGVVGLPGSRTGGEMIF